MSDDTDMTAEEFWADRDEGIPVRVVKSRTEYEATLRIAGLAGPGPAGVVHFQTATGFAPDDHEWLVMRPTSTAGSTTPGHGSRRRRVGVVAS